MKYFKFFIDVFVMIYQTCNVDFFGLGFGFLDFILGSILLVLVIEFLKNGIGNPSGGSILSSGLSLAKGAKDMDNADRESAVVKNNIRNSYNLNLIYNDSKKTYKRKYKWSKDVSNPVIKKE